MLLVNRVSSQEAFHTSQLDNGAYFGLLRHMQYHASGVNLSVKDAIAIPGNQFTSFTGKNKNFGFVRKYYWLRFILYDDIQKGRYHFVSGNRGINRMELFRKKGDAVESMGKTGDHYPYSLRPYWLNAFSYPLQLSSSAPDTFYLFVDKKDENLELQFILFDDIAINQYASHLYLTSGISAGLLLMALLFQLFLFLNTGERLHLWYGLYSLAVISYFFAIKNMDFEFFTQHFPFWTNISRPVTGTFVVVLLLTMMQAFLEQNRSGSRYYRWVNLNKVLLLLSAVACIVVFRFFPIYELKVAYHLLLDLLVLVAFILVYLSCIEKWKQGFSLAFLFMIAVSFLVLVSIITMLNILGLIDFVYTQPSLIEIATTIETLIICFAILYRYIIFRKRQARLAIEMEEHKSQLTRSMIAVQESEQKRIAQDLHDELGGNLAALKMTIQALPLEEEKLVPALQLIDHASENTRHISHNLMPPEFSTTGLVDLLDHHFQRLNHSGTTRFQFYSTGTPGNFSKTNELLIYRMMLELSSNVVKHAHASQAVFQFIYYEDRLEIMAEDNGRGFSPSGTQGMGLKNIRSRVDYLGGKLTIDSGLRGTTIIIQIPYQIQSYGTAH